MKVEEFTDWVKSDECPAVVTMFVKSANGDVYSLSVPDDTKPNELKYVQDLLRKGQASEPA